MSRIAPPPTTTTITNGAFSVEVIGVGVKPALQGNYIPIPHNTEFALRLVNNWRTRASAAIITNGTPDGTYQIGAMDSTSPIERSIHETKKFTYLEEKTDEFAEAGGEAKASENGVIEVVFKPEKDYSRDRSCMESYDGNESFCASKSLSAKRSKGKKPELGGGPAPCAASSSSSSSSWPLDLFGGPPAAASAPASLGGFGGFGGFGGGEPQMLGGRSAAPTYTHGMIALGSHSTQTFRTVPAITDFDTERITKIVFRFVTAKPEPRFESVAAAASRAGMPTKTMAVPPRFD